MKVDKSGGENVYLEVDVIALLNVVNFSRLRGRRSGRVQCQICLSER
jgi:hypothetical protein